MSILLFRSLLLLAAALILCSSVSNAVPMKEQEKRVMPGGYHKIPDLRDVRVRQAATFAMEQKMVGQQAATLAEDARPVVVRGFQQVVAGMNYNLEIVMIQGNDDEVLGGFSVTVYDQFGQLSITKWGNDLTKEEAEAVFNGGQGLQ